MEMCDDFPRDSYKDNNDVLGRGGSSLKISLYEDGVR